MDNYGYWTNDSWYELPADHYAGCVPFNNQVECAGIGFTPTTSISWIDNQFMLHTNGLWMMTASVTFLAGQADASVRGFITADQISAVESQGKEERVIPAGKQETLSFTAVVHVGASGPTGAMNRAVYVASDSLAVQILPNNVEIALLRGESA